MADRVSERENSTAPAERWYKRVSWGAIFVGVLVAIGIQITLSMLGIAVGLASIDVFGEQEPGGLAIGTVVWLIITGIISLFCGGWVTGRLSGDVVKLDRALNGLAVWSLTIVLSVYLMSATASAIVGGAFGLLGTGAEAVVGVAPEAAEFLEGNGEGPLQGLQDEAEELLQEAQEASPEEREQIQQELEIVLDAIGELIAEGELTEQNHNQVTDILARRTEMSEQQADSAVSAWETEARETREEVLETAEEVREAAAATAAGLFFILVLSGAASALGAYLAGNPNPKKP
ncbi:hypothetical protein QA601_14170 [Chitinispirillales bacterium ANBcel5]|uniref:hypothetical protein n=1 Tax=Cellulosispirillum alkaliphilum TaxID=3039283 RepID=UPI002A53494E|nr:hypothetical protein [Chitinispirillales bacterium ANBcel5]